MLLPVLLIFGGYTLTSYGWVLLKGWDITFAQWVSPIHPWQFTDGQDPGTVPSGQVFPGKGQQNLNTDTGNEFKVTPGELKV